MEKLIFLDTHVVLWLYGGEFNLLPPEVTKIINLKPVAISPMVILELQYLYEVGKIKTNAVKIVESLQKSIGLKTIRGNFQEIVDVSLKLSWTRDPFDRLIVAQAMLNGVPLLSKDETIRKHYRAAIWR